MKNPIRPLALAAAAMLTASACNDNAFLTEVPIDFVGPSNFYKTAADALASVNGVYGTLEATSGTNYYGGLFVMLVEFPTEMQTVYLSATNERSQVDNYTFTVQHNYIYQSWLFAYASINRANATINNVPGIQMNVALRDRIVGEAKFLRALNYFNLVRLFRGVPLQTVETTSLADIKKPRATSDEVYAQIIQDLKDAIAVLPQTYGGGDVGRATRGAAKTLLAKVYLQRAGTGAAATAQADYQLALTTLQDVENTEGYALLTNFGDLFDTKHEANTEVIFDVQCTRAAGVGCKVSNQVSPRSSNYGATPAGSFTSEQPFFDEFKLTDKRRPITWQLTFMNKSNAVVTWSATQTVSGTYGADTPYIRKFLDSLSTGDDENNYIILRYADNLLMKAEAINEISGGPNAQAYAAVNLVRNRAGIGDLTAGLSQAAFRDSVFHERRLELAMEGPNGFFDSQRNWNWAKARVAANMALGRANNFRNSKYPKLEVVITDKFKIMPIPQRAIDLNPTLVQQTEWLGT